MHSFVATAASLFVNAGERRLSPADDGSPAINAGTSQFAPPADFDGLPRPAGAAFDIGAYEFAAHCPGDYNRDGDVDAADYVVWRKTLGTTVTRYAAPMATATARSTRPTTPVASNFGGSRGSGLAAGAAIPEPTIVDDCCALASDRCSTSRDVLSRGFQLRRKLQPLLFQLASSAVSFASSRVQPLGFGRVGDSQQLFADARFSSSSRAILRSTAFSFFCASRSARARALRSTAAARGIAGMLGGARGVRSSQAGVDFLLHAVDVVVVVARVAGHAAVADFDHVRRHAVHEVAVVAGEDHRALVAASAPRPAPRPIRRRDGCPARRAPARCASAAAGRPAQPGPLAAGEDADLLLDHLAAEQQAAGDVLDLLRLRARRGLVFEVVQHRLVFGQRRVDVLGVDADLAAVAPRTSPASGGSEPQTVRRNVVLPWPLSPTTPTRVP